MRGTLSLEHGWKQLTVIFLAALIPRCSWVSIRSAVNGHLKRWRRFTTTATTTTATAYHYHYHYHYHNDHHHHQGFAFLYKLGLLSIEPHWDYQIEIGKKTDEMNILVVSVVAGLFSVGTC